MPKRRCFSRRVNRSKNWKRKRAAEIRSDLACNVSIHLSTIDVLRRQIQAAGNLPHGTISHIYHIIVCRQECLHDCYRLDYEQQMHHTHTTMQIWGSKTRCCSVPDKNWKWPHVAVICPWPKGIATINFSLLACSYSSFIRTLRLSQNKWQSSLVWSQAMSYLRR